ncbi:MAG: PAS domain S-box protein [Candidatus Bathyarchaeota archaeon]|nr:PAS domain S-box protein [Candidatus Bathyarchaeum tardum]WGM89187.1 MAG: PAS domain S-box protein [Candidatus Bathyarchaeum tardum]WNZ28573.1 MAG: PAS domain S-box protein [Candidatus Bathyarchaeota archaeon]
MTNHFSEDIQNGETFSDIQVLCVDDEVGLSQTVKQILEKQGSINVETACSVKEALQKISKKRFDVVVSDYQMPEKSGLDFLKILRDAGNNIPFILFTGKGREEVAVEALNLGAERYFNKFGDPETVYCELAHGIRQVVSQRKAEKKVWDREERLRAIIASSPDMMIVSDRNGYITDCNREALKLFDVSSKDDIIGNHFQTLVAEGQHNIFENIRENLLKNGFINKIESKLMTKSGSELFVEFSANLLKDAHGNIVGGVALARDVTERKQTETALKLSEEKIRAIMRSANDAIILMDPKGNISYWNEAAEKIFGYSKGEVIGKGVHDLLGPKRFQEACMKQFSNFKVSGKGFPVGLTLEMPALKKDGSEFPAELSVSAFKLDNQWHAVSILRDITERKNAENALKQSEKRFRELSELLPEIIYEANPEGTLVFANKEALVRFGYTLQDFKKGIKVSEVIAPEHRHLATKNIKRLLRGEPTGPTEYNALTKDGNIFPIMVHSVPIFHNHEVLGFRGIILDITVRKEAENKLKESLDNLRNLNEKLDVVGKLTRHDARNKLSVILNHVFLAKNQLSQPDKVLEHLDAVESAVELIEKIFKFSRIYEKLGKEKLSCINLKETFDEAIALHSCSDTISFVNDCDGLMVLGDSLLRQLFYNLIDNSLKHGEKVSQIKLYWKDENDRIKLIYEDNGIGIPETEKQKIFKEGYGKGSGYGLFLIAKLCEVYGWSIQETGIFNDSAQFTITIPKTGLDSTGSQ